MSALTYLVAWRPISARIDGLENAAAAHARARFELSESV